MAELSPVAFLAVGYVITVAIEAPVLWWGLSPRHSPHTKQLAIFGLTAATYPGVVLVLPPLLTPWFGYGGYVAIAETLVALAESLIFRFIIAADRTSSSRSRLRDTVVIVGANMASFVAGSTVLSNIPSG